MTPPADPFESLSTLETRFADGLATMLADHAGLGVYILVFANTCFEPAARARLSSVLTRRHGELLAAMADTLRQGHSLEQPDDDVMVFLKLDLIGVERIGTVEHRRCGPWHVLFNPLRALRPPRASRQLFGRLRRPFDPDGFHFNLPFLAKEVLWEGPLGGKFARLLYNKFPFARLHGLLVPEPQAALPQYLTPELHQWAWSLCSASGLPGLCLGYNSLGAGASVNHLHFQSFVQPEPLPVQGEQFSHNGGTEPYPLPVLRFEDALEAWLEIDRLHSANAPYNLVYSQDCLHLVARRPQDDTALPDDSRGYGWSEMAGAVTLYSRDAFLSFDADAFASRLARFAP